MTRSAVLVALAMLAPAAAAAQGAGLIERLEAIDADADGLIQRAELADWRGSVFAAMDADSDALLTREEYMSVQLGPGADPARRGPRYEQMQQAKDAEYTAMDADGDDRVDLPTFLAEADARFTAADANGDGALTAPEFVRMHAAP